MSFSFSNKRAATKAGILALAALELARVVEQQPVHAADVPAIEKAVAAHVELLAEPNEAQEIDLSVSGSVTAQVGSTTTPDRITWLNMNVSAGLVSKPAPETVVHQSV